MYSSAYVWAKVLGLLESKLTPTVVSTWFDDAEVIELTGDTLTLYTPSAYRKDIIQRRCLDYVKDAMRELFNMEVEVVVLDEEDMRSWKSQEKRPEQFEFNPQFTFDSYVVGSSNRFAHAAAVAVANAPAENYNPLLLYGQSGLGKTHLLYAIANEIRRQHPDFSIVYLKGDQFTNELISAIREGKNVEFRSKYRNADLFLMDDIQFIAGKESTEEEFFHTFNTLYEAHKQIVLTSDRPPQEMNTLADRIRTRIEWGLLADIQPPDYETRMAIIKSKADSMHLTLPDDVCSFIAENITNNVRQLEGTVKKILAHHELAGEEITVASVQRTIKDMYKGKPETLPTAPLIISEVAKYYGIDESVIRSKLKNKGTAEARTGLSLPEIGREFDRDHSTILYSIRKIEQLVKSGDAATQATIRDITANINNRL
jgi:chromosomal replication initiator protein